MFSAVDPSPQYEGVRANYRPDRVKKPVSTPVNARDVQPRLVHEDPADEVRGLGKRKIPATTQRPTRGTNVRTVYARLLHQPYADAGRFQMHEGDVVFVGRSTTLVGPRLGAYSSGAVVGAGTDRFARVATWRQVNGMLERPENTLRPTDPALFDRLAAARDEWKRMMEQRSLAVLDEVTIADEGTAATLYRDPRPKPTCKDAYARLKAQASGMKRDVSRACSEERRARTIAMRSGLPIEPEIDWMAVPALSNWTPDGVLLNTDRVKEVISELLPTAVDNELLLNVVVQGPCPLRNDKHAKDGQFFQQDAKAGDSLYLCIVHRRDAKTGEVSFRLKPCAGGQMQTLFDLTASSASAITLLAEKDEADGSTFGAQDLLHTVAAWRIGRVVDTRLVTNVPQRRMGLSVNVELLTWDALWASLSHSDEPALLVRDAYRDRMLGIEERKKPQTVRTTMGEGRAPAAAPEVVATEPSPVSPAHFLWNMYKSVWSSVERKAKDAFAAVANGASAVLHIPTLKRLAGPSQLTGGATTEAAVVATVVGGTKQEVASKPLPTQQALKDAHQLATRVGFFREWDRAMQRGLTPEEDEGACAMMQGLTHPFFGKPFGEILVLICNKVRDRGYRNVEDYNGGLHFNLLLLRGGKEIAITNMDLSEEMGKIEGTREDKVCAISEALNFLFRAPSAEQWAPSNSDTTWTRPATDRERWGPHQDAWNYYVERVTVASAGTGTRATYMAMMIGAVVLGVGAAAYMVSQTDQQTWAAETAARPPPLMLPAPEPPPQLLLPAPQPPPKLLLPPPPQQQPDPSPSEWPLTPYMQDSGLAATWGEFVRSTGQGAPGRLWAFLYNWGKLTVDDVREGWTPPPPPVPGGIGDAATAAAAAPEASVFGKAFSNVFAWSGQMGAEQMMYGER